MEVVQLVKDFMTENAMSAVVFYLDNNCTWYYQDITEHLGNSFKSGKTFCSLISDFHSNVQHGNAPDDKFTNCKQ